MIQSQFAPVIISGLLPRCMNHCLYDSLNLHGNTGRSVQIDVLNLVIHSSNESSI
jgi:hypothetical protein